MPKTFAPRDPDFERRVRASFARQAAMQTIGAIIERVSPGEVDVALPFRADLTQQHGFLHAGIAASVLDSAAGYAALTLMDLGAAVLSVDFRVQLIAPARGAWFRALGRIVRAGRTINVVSAELRAHKSAPVHGVLADEGEVVTLLSGTMMTVRDRPGLTD